jgi:hypothetical protein
VANSCDKEMELAGTILKPEKIISSPNLAPFEFPYVIG